MNRIQTCGWDAYLSQYADRSVLDIFHIAMLNPTTLWHACLCVRVCYSCSSDSVVLSRGLISAGLISSSYRATVNVFLIHIRLMHYLLITYKNWMEVCAEIIFLLGHVRNVSSFSRGQNTVHFWTQYLTVIQDGLVNLSSVCNRALLMASLKIK